jgi:hypothetical protein
MKKIFQSYFDQWASIIYLSLSFDVSAPKMVLIHFYFLSQMWQNILYHAFNTIFLFILDLRSAINQFYFQSEPFSPLMLLLNIMDTTYVLDYQMFMDLFNRK